MIKASKFLVLFGGILGVAAFFQPFLTGTTEDGQDISMSAWSLLHEIEAAGEKQRSSPDPATQLMANIDALPGILWIPVVMPVFGAAFLIMLLGAWGVLRRRFGRLFGLGAFVLGGFVLGFALILMLSGAGDHEMQTGIGGKMLLVTGLCGFVCGFVTLIKPDRRRRATPSTPD